MGPSFRGTLRLGLGIGPKSATVPVYGELAACRRIATILTRSPIAAECAPAPIHGACVMQWQFFNAFGIMVCLKGQAGAALELIAFRSGQLGYVADLAFYQVPNKPNIAGLNWRLMLGAAGLSALVVMIQVWAYPGSPRWLMGKRRYAKAYQAMLRLRGKPLLAARDIFYIHVLLQEEEAVIRGRHRVLELFTVPRNRRATLASLIVVCTRLSQPERTKGFDFQEFLADVWPAVLRVSPPTILPIVYAERDHQFFSESMYVAIDARCERPCKLTCRGKAIVYYSSSIFLQANFSEQSALLASWGFGMVNFVFAFPYVLSVAVCAILLNVALHLCRAFLATDRFGRRSLLFFTFPFMGVFQLVTGMAFFIPDQQARIAVVALGI